MFNIERNTYRGCLSPRCVHLLFDEQESFESRLLIAVRFDDRLGQVLALLAEKLIKFSSVLSYHLVQWLIFAIDASRLQRV